MEAYLDLNMIDRFIIQERNGGFLRDGLFFETKFEIDFNRKEIITETKNDVDYVCYREVARLPLNSLDYPESSNFSMDLIEIQSMIIDTLPEIIEDDTMICGCDILPTEVIIYFSDGRKEVLTPGKTFVYIDKIEKKARRLVNKLKNL